MVRRGWFEIPDVQEGPRTLDEQLQGLQGVLDVAGRSVLDLGCAEGLIARWCIEQGAARAFAVDCFRPGVTLAQNLCAGLPVEVVRADLEKARPWVAQRFDVVLLLAILHKLREPQHLINDLIAMEPAEIVVRLPPATPGYVLDERSGMREIPVSEPLIAAGYTLTEGRGPRFEWMGYYRK